jgi:hypothetical protein
MTLRPEHARVSQLMSDLTISWPIVCIDPDVLDDIEKSAGAGDALLARSCKAMLGHFKNIRQPQDQIPISQAYEEYSEASIYLLLKQRGLNLDRTPGTGGVGKKRPDFVHSQNNGELYIEVKSLDFDEGQFRHNRLAVRAMENAAELDGRSRTPGVHIGRELEISSFDLGAGPAERIEIIIRKVRGNAKLEQLRYGPTLLVVDLGRLNVDATDPSCLTPIYFDQGAAGDPACASGELWHISLGRVGNMIYKLPSFAGQTNLDRQLTEDGTLVEYPELLGISFVVRRPRGPSKLYTIWNLRPDVSNLANGLTLEEDELGAVIHQISDVWNNTANERANDLQVRR